MRESKAISDSPPRIIIHKVLDQVNPNYQLKAHRSKTDLNQKPNLLSSSRLTVPKI